MEAARQKPDGLSGTSGQRAGTMSLWAGGLAVLWMPVSISLAQFFYAVAMLLLLVEWWQTRGVHDAWPPRFRRLMLTVVMLYGSWVLSAVVHATLTGSTSPLSALLRSDLKDVLLSGMAVWALHHAQHSPGRRRDLYRFVAGGFLIVLLSGLVAVFSPYRLSRILYHMQHGWTFSADARLQHPMFHLPLGFARIPLHMPVGFLGTHLAYGAQLGLYFIPVVLFLMDRLLLWQDRSGDGGQGPGAIGPRLSRVAPFRRWGLFAIDRTTLIVSGLAVLAAVVLLLNNARSALVGIIIALLAGVMILSGRRWKKRAWLLLVPVLGGAGIVLGGMLATGRGHALRELLMQSVGLEEKHSDYQRVMLWSTVGRLIREQPIIGTGPGQFSDSVLDRMNEQAADRPWLWYLYMQTERGHAHNDFLHQLASAGLPAALLFVLLWYWILRMAFGQTGGELTPNGQPETASNAGGGFRPDEMFREFIPFAPLLLFAGGVFQCFFLDDQVLLPFWLMVGLAYQAREGQPLRG